MALIKIFGRVLPLASDDLTIPYILGIWTKILIITFNSIVLILFKKNIGDRNVECNVGNIYNIIYVGYFIICLSTLCDILISLTSYRGTMSNRAPRRHLGKLLYISAIILAAECAYAVNLLVTFMQLAIGKRQCDAGGPIIAFGLYSGFFIGAKALWIRLVHALFSLSREKEHQAFHLSNKKRWRSNFQKVYGRKELTYAGNIEPNLNDVVEFLATLISEFTSQLEYSIFDIMAGIVLLKREEKLKGTRKLKTPSCELNSDASQPNPDVLFSLNEIFHIFQFSEMTYGTPIKTARRIVRFVTRLFCPLSSRFFFFSTTNNVDHYLDASAMPSSYDTSGCFNSKIKTNKRVGSGCIQPTTLILCSSTNTLFNLPFIVLGEHCYKHIVITIRGTSSADDFFVDLYTKMVSIEFPSVQADPEKYYAHSGFLRCAANIRDKLLSSGVLGLIFNEMDTYKDYSLTCIGHSLGAAVAVLLTCLLREINNIPKAKCIAYSPPSAVLSPGAAELVKEFVVSVTVGDDIVSRMTKESVKNLIGELVVRIDNCDQKKLEIVWDLIFSRSKFYKYWRKLRCNRAICLGNSNNENDLSVSLRKNTESDAKYKYFERVEPRTVLPGRILHIVPHTPKSETKEKTKYDIYWAESSAFHDIVISSTTLTSHIPQNFIKIMKPDSVNSYPPELGPLTLKPD